MSFSIQLILYLMCDILSLVIYLSCFMIDFKYVNLQTYRWYDIFSKFYFWTKILFSFIKIAMHVLFLTPTSG